MSQIPQPSFLQSDEEAKELINDHIYLTRKKGDTNINSPGTKFYFTDGHGKVFNTFNVFPSSTVLGSQMYVHYSKKYLTIRRSYVDGKNEMLDGFVLDKEGRILWHIPRKEMVGEVFANDENDTILVIDTWRGHLKIYDVNGKEKSEKVFSEQNEQKFPDLATPGEDAVIWGGPEPSENSDYIAVYRASRDIKDFASELTLLDSIGNVLFQNQAPQSKVGMPLKVLEI